MLLQHTGRARVSLDKSSRDLQQMPTSTSRDLTLTEATKASTLSFGMLMQHAVSCDEARLGCVQARARLVS